MAETPTKLIDERQLSDQLSISVETIRKWRYETPNKGPRFRKLGRAVRYSIADVEQWISERS